MAVILDHYVTELTACGLTIGSSYRYPCTPPADCCDDELAIWRGAIGRTNNPPSLNFDCACKPGKIAVELNLRLARCWPTDVLDPAGKDAAATIINDDAWCLALVSQRLICSTPPAVSEHCHGICGWEVKPWCPRGGCAGNTVRLFALLNG